jgi:hypothetical protein
MSNSNRIIGAAIGLTLSIFIAASTHAEDSLPRQRNSDSEAQNSDGASKQADKNSRVANMCGSSFTLNCAGQEKRGDAQEDRRNEREESDLIAQRDAANAAADSAWWSRAQFWASLAAIFGLVWTLIETRRIGQAQTRAYINVVSGIVSNFGADKVPIITIHIKNGGVTPARNVDTATIGHCGDIKDIIPKISFDGLPVHNSDIGAGEGNTLQVSPDGALKQSHIDKINVGTGAIWGYGRVTYVDVFGKRHFTNFCLIFCRHDTVNGVHPDGRMANYHEGNSAD